MLKWGGVDPVYCGPSLGWPFLALGFGVFVVAIASSTFWLLIVPVLYKYLYTLGERVKALFHRKAVPVAQPSANL